MSRKAVIASLILVLALGAAAFVLLQRPEADHSPGRLLPFEPAKASALIVEQPGADTEGAHRLGDGSEWEIRWTPAGEDVSRSWPALPAQVRAALRILSTLEPAAGADRGMKPDAGAARVRLTLDDKTERVFRLASQPMAGRVLMEVVDPGPDRPDTASHVYWVDAALADALVGTGLRAWRDRAAFPNLGSDTSRIILTGERATLSLARVAGRWALREPVAAPADDQAVRSLLAAVGAIQITDFGESGIPIPAQSRPPLAGLRLETDRRVPAGESFLTRTDIRQAEFANIAGLAGDQVMVRLRRTTETRYPDGRVEKPEPSLYVFTVPLASAAGLSANPEAYLSRVAAAPAAADVGRVVIRRTQIARTFARTIDGWSESRDGGASVPLAPDDRTGLDALLKLLCETRADAASLKQPEASSTEWTIELQSLGGDPLGALDVGMVPGDGTGTPVVHTPPVWRIYAPTPALSAMRWLDGIAR